MSEIELLKAENLRLKKIISEFENIMDRSKGVAGMQLGEDINDWEFLKGGVWLYEYNQYELEKYG